MNSSLLRNASVSVSFYTQALAGNLFCASLTSPPINTNMVKLAAAAGNSYIGYSILSIGNVSKVITIGSMSPATTYKIYCYLENLKSMGKSGLVSRNQFCVNI